MIKIIEQIEGLVSSKIATIKTIYSIFKLEAKLAGLSVYPLLLNLCMLFVVLITVWLSIMLLVGYYTILFFGTFILSVVFVLLLNLVLLIGLLKYLSFNLNKMSFEKTRAYFSSNESNKDDELKKTINSKNSNSGKKITLPTKPID